MLLCLWLFVCCALPSSCPLRCVFLQGLLGVFALPVCLTFLLCFVLLAKSHDPGKLQSSSVSIQDFQLMFLQKLIHSTVHQDFDQSGFNHAQSVHPDFNLDELEDKIRMKNNHKKGSKKKKQKENRRNVGKIVKPKMGPVVDLLYWNRSSAKIVSVTLMHPFHGNL